MIWCNAAGFCVRAEQERILFLTGLPVANVRIQDVLASPQNFSEAWQARANSLCADKLNKINQADVLI